MGAIFVFIMRAESIGMCAMDGWMKNRRIDGRRTDGYMDGFSERWVDEWIDGWVCGRTEE
jgi:hypothetical protein